MRPKVISRARFLDSYAISPALIIYEGSMEIDLIDQTGSFCKNF